jgi:hypothetical protein
MHRDIFRLSAVLLLFGALLMEALAEQPSGEPKPSTLGAPPGFGIGPGIAGGTDALAFGIDAYGMVPALVVGPVWMLKLEDKQLRRIDDILNLQRKQQWAFMYQMMAENARLHKLFEADRWDVGAITDVYDVIYTLRRGRIQSLARMRNQIYDILTPEQRAQLGRIRQAEPWPRSP